MPRSLQVELRPQINLTRLGIVRQKVRRAFSQDFTVQNQVSAVDQLQGFTHVVVRDEYSQTPRLQTPNDLLHFVNRDRIDPAERFVQQQQFGTGDQSALRV